MSDHENERFDVLLERVLEVATAEQRVFIEGNCDDPELRRRLIEALAKDAEVSQFLERPAVLALEADEQETGQPSLEMTKPASFSIPHDLPATIGPFRIRELLGEGGMGVVYLAEQDEPVERQLAVKVVRADLTASGVRERFAAERQALARLSHPHIAQMYEAGATEQGFPYFAMELISGESITEYCDRCQMSIEERLGLFVQVCEGVQHAHQRGIIHRDLKPSNIMVSEVEGRPVPKLIDFGIAKALDRPLTDVTQLTGLGAVGTPAYMSPESLGLGDDALDPDTRTDVYALGIVLYELLAGVRPFDLNGGSVAQVLQRLTSEDAPRPSIRVAALEEAERSAVAGNRGLAADTLPRRLASDLDWITARAIAKERDERYDSVGDLAADVERHLTDQPVLASPPSVRYRARKFVRRHRAGVVAAMLVALALIAGAVGTTIGMVRAHLEAERANREAERANLEAAAATEVSDFMTGLFEVSDPSEARGNSITAREMLDKGAEVVEGELAGQPLLQARMMNVIGTVYQSLGLYAQATPLLEQALALRRKHLGGEHSDLAESMHNLAGSLKSQGEYEAAEPLLREALDMRRRLLGKDHRDVADSLNSLAMLLRRKGENEAAEPLLREALNINRRLFGNDDNSVAENLNDLAVVLATKGDWDGADRHMSEALDIRRRLFGDHPGVVVTLVNHATGLMARGNYEAGEPFIREALEMARRVYGDDHNHVAYCLSRLGFLEKGKGELEAAESHYREALAMRRRLLGNDHPDIAEDIYSLAGLMSRRGDHEAADTFHREALAMRRRLLGPEHQDIAASLKSLADSLEERGDVDSAESLYREALAMYRGLFGEDHPRIASIQRGLAELKLSQGELDAAETQAHQSLAMLRRLLDKDGHRAADTLVVLVRIDVARGRFAEAERQAREATGIYRQAGLPRHHIAIAELYLADALIGLDRYVEAESLLLPILEIETETLNWKARKRLVKLYAAWGKPEAAERHREPGTDGS